MTAVLSKLSPFDRFQ